MKPLSDDPITETKVPQKLTIKPKIKDPRLTSNIDFTDSASATSDIRAKTLTPCTNNQQKISNETENLESMEYDSDDIYDEDDFIEISSKRGTPRKIPQEKEQTL